MSSFRSVLFLAVIASLIAVPASAVAAGCRVMVTKGGEAQKQVKVEAMGADQVVLIPTKTDDNGLAQFTEGTLPLYVMVAGMEAGRCNGQLAVDVGVLIDRHNAQNAQEAANNANGGAGPENSGATPADDNPGTDNAGATPGETESAEDKKKKKKKKTGGK